MESFIDTFPLRQATKYNLGLATSYAYAEFNSTMGRASSLRKFFESAHKAGVHVPLTQDYRELAGFAIEEGIINQEHLGFFQSPETLEKFVKHTTETAELSAKIAMAVLIHAGFERFLWSMCRIGAAADRQKVLAWLADKNIKLARLTKVGAEQCEDDLIGQWLQELEKQTCLDKWKRFANLFGLPDILVEPPKWRFTEVELGRFDEARHDAVHHSGASLAEFDLDAFQFQLTRAVLAMIVHVAKKHQFTCFQEGLVGGTIALDALRERDLKAPSASNRTLPDASSHQ